WPTPRNVERGARSAERARSAPRSALRAPRSTGARAGCWPRSAGGRATGAGPTRVWSRAAGSSSTTTASTRTPTTRRWCRWRWPGRWGVNYLYGTWQVLAGLGRVGLDPRRPLVRRAVAWLKAVQQPGGGWGESCKSYDDPAFAGVGTPTASQTAWALLGLMAA